MLALRNWLWKGSFEIDAVRLDTWEGSEEEMARKDLVGRTSDYLSELWRLINLAEEVEHRQTSENSYEIQNLAKSMLPVLDALDRIIEFGHKRSSQDEEFQNWIASVEGVGSRLQRTLDKIGLVPMSCIGAEVDLELHDVVATRKSSEYVENTIIEERQKGYYFRGRLLRDAKVVVALPS